MSVQKALQVIGFSEPEARIIEYMLDRTACSAAEIIEGTGMSRGTVYKALSNLVDSGRVSKTRTRPVGYSITRGLTTDIKKEFTSFYKSFSKRISQKGVIERRKVALEVFQSFEKNGFAIRDAPPLDSRRLRFPIFDKIADAEYSVAISIFDKSKKLETDYPEFLFIDQIHSTCRRLNCIVPFIFIHNDRKDFEKLYRKLSRFSKRIQRRPRLEQYREGIEDRGFYLFKTTIDLDRAITEAVREIRERHLLVKDLVSKLREKAAANHELVLLSQEHIKSIDDFLVRSRPFTRSRLVRKRIGELSEPIQRIKNRESRNLRIIRRLFSEYEVRINQSIDRIEGRTFLPSIESMKNDISELEQFEEKFKPIEYELNYLRQGLFRYAMDLSRTKKEGVARRINPFLFTEPYEKTPFYVDQRKLEKAALDLSNSILGELPAFFQIIIGEAGIGKTHCLKYIYTPIMEKKKIKTLYIDCPVSYDLFAGVFQELTQEILYPKEVAPAIRNLRRVTPTVTRDFIRILSEIAEIFKKLDYEGVLVILDELENSLPYVIRARGTDLERRGYRHPIALRQIRELLTSDLSIPNMGFVISCRSRIFPMLEASLEMENIKEFTYEPEVLSPKEFIEIAEHRYKMWNVNKPEFDEEAIGEITKKTKGNTRNVIKYCRALFEFGRRNKLERISKEDVRKIGPIPMFVF